MYRVLIVDDERFILQGMEALIKKGNHGIDEIRTAKDAEIALSEINSGYAPDILITDIRMPHMSGIDLVQKLRDSGSKIRVIALSGYNDFEYVRAMAVLGIENYLLKPVNENELNATLSSVIQEINHERKQKIRTQMDENLIRENIINRWLYDSIEEAELLDRAEFLNINLNYTFYQPCVIRFLENEKNSHGIREIKDQVFDICIEKFIYLNIASESDKMAGVETQDAEQSECSCYFSKSYSGDTLVVFGTNKENNNRISRILNQCMNDIHSQLGQKVYLLLGKTVEGFWDVSSSFREAISDGIYIDTVFCEAGEERLGSGSPLSHRMMEYVLKHYQEDDLSLKTLSSIIHGNSAYMGQIFKRDLGCSFSEYLKQTRMEQAKKLLLYGDHSVQEIAGMIGYFNVPYFTSLFKKETGMSPVEYKRFQGK